MHALRFIHVKARAAMARTSTLHPEPKVAWPVSSPRTTPAAAGARTPRRRVPAHRARTVASPASAHGSLLCQGEGLAGRGRGGDHGGGGSGK